MTNERKLELTLCSMLPHELKAQCIDDELANGFDSMIRYKKGYVFQIDNEDLDIEISRHYKPLLNSLNKLTEPILDGGLIPMDEFRKIAPFNDSNDELAKDMIDMFKEDLIMVPFWVIKKLKEWHFNIYDLPSNMYIEKSTVNL